MSNIEPEGDLVTGPAAIYPPADLILKGQHGVTLVPLAPEHMPDLFLNVGGSSNAHLYRYMLSGPFLDLESFTKHYKSLINSTIFVTFAICSATPPHLSNKESKLNASTSGTAIGIICLMKIATDNRSVEIGHVLFGPTLQRTTAATEANYLLMKWAFEEGHYLRVEWKTNSFNEPSKRAALRLGFKFEGVFRKHMVVKGRRRDSAWFSILDDEWFSEGKGGVKAALEAWLSESNFVEGKQIKKLEVFRE